jgi:hypothetical protein
VPRNYLRGFGAGFLELAHKVCKPVRLPEKCSRALARCGAAGDVQIIGAGKHNFHFGLDPSDLIKGLEA